MARGLHERLQQLEDAIWSRRTVTSAPSRWMLRAVRLAFVLLRDVINGDLTLWTMSLVYTTLLSMVPLLALSFSVLKAFGVHNQIEPLLDSLLAPLGEQGVAISSRIVAFIEKMNVGVLGAVGLALLIYTVFSLMQKIEEAFNAIWHVSELRSLGERFSRYLSALLIGPILVFSALGVTATALNSTVAHTLISIEPIGTLVLLLGRLVPYLLVIGAFTFLYAFVPNTRVRFPAALAGGITAGIAWQSAGWGFALFVASSTRYQAIYSSFAILVLFLIWLYVSWLVLLTGASVSFYVQNPDYLRAGPGEPDLSIRMRERLALAVMTLVARHFCRGRAPWTLQTLTESLQVPMRPVGATLDSLCKAGLLTRTDDERAAYLPSRDLASISVADALAAVRLAGDDDLASATTPVWDEVDRVFARVERALDETTRGVTLRAIGEGSVPAAEPLRSTAQTPAAAQPGVP